MTRLMIATMLLAVAVAPAFACEAEKSAATDVKSRSIASQPAPQQSPMPPRTTTDRSPS
jgi:hypothetical protein